MRCADCLEALSALSDGELGDLERLTVTTHLEGCASCRGYAAQIDQLNRHFRLRPAEAVPDLSGRIVAGAAPAPRPARQPREWARYLLVWVGLVQVALAAPALFGSAAGTSVHAAREVGSFDLAIGVGLLVVAWQPRRAAGLLPMVAALVGALLLTAGFDVAAGRVSLGAEGMHIFDLIGLAGLWALSRSLPTRRQRPRGGLLPA